MHLAVLISIVVLMANKPNVSGEALPQPIVTDSVQELKIVFAGDVMQHLPQVDAAWDCERGEYIYDSCFKYLKGIVSSTDLAIANLETTLAGEPYSGYPAFSSPNAIVTGLLHAGFDIVGTANNHCCDRGRKGIERTLAVLDSLGMTHFGTYRNEEDFKHKSPLIVRAKGFKIAFLNYTYGTNGIPIPDNKIVNLIDKERMEADLKAAQDSGVDFRIVFIHWGEEYQRQPNEYQKDIAHFLFAKGADLVVGSHPHVIEPMEWQKADSLGKDHIVVWSLGNFVSNQRKRYTDGGTLFTVTLKKNKQHAWITDATYLLTWVYNPTINGQRQYFILPAARFENDTMLLDKQAHKDLQLFLSDSRTLLEKENIGIGEAK